MTRHAQEHEAALLRAPAARRMANLRLQRIGFPPIPRSTWYRWLREHRFAHAEYSPRAAGPYHYWLAPEDCTAIIDAHVHVTAKA